MIFIDLFSGCGGLSLGLLKAGWNGLFAIEKSRHAFETLNNNLMGQYGYKYDWPHWLPIKPITIDELITNYQEHLIKLNGKIDLIAGGPPCQGFSFAGKRQENDPRNTLVNKYLHIVSIINPQYLLLENVYGFQYGFSKNGKKSIACSRYVTDILKSLGYTVYYKLINCVDFFVPQNRIRFIMIAIKNLNKKIIKNKKFCPFNLIQQNMKSFSANKNFVDTKIVTSKMAIDDLKTKNKKIIDCIDTDQRGFKQIKYEVPSKLNEYLSVIRENLNGEMPNSMRLVNHKDSTRNKFNEILKTCERGRTICVSDRKRLKISKQSLTPLDEDKPSSTITTLPDDIIHYSEPRILTVRETARLQSFPDWFSFHGKYTTGGKLRVNECPRYSQVGNAVPPFVSEAIGSVLLKLRHGEIDDSR